MKKKQFGTVQFTYDFFYIDFKIIIAAFGLVKTV